MAHVVPVPAGSGRLGTAAFPPGHYSVLAADRCYGRNASVCPSHNWQSPRAGEAQLHITPGLADGRLSILGTDRSHSCLTISSSKSRRFTSQCDVVFVVCA